MSLKDFEIGKELGKGALAQFYSLSVNKTQKFTQ